MLSFNVCGFTANQNNTTLSNRKGVINFSNILPKILEEKGNKVSIGDFDNNSDVNFVFIYTLESLNTQYALKCLELIKNNPKSTVICLDDWNIKDVFNGFERILRGQKTFKSHPHYKQEQIKEYFEVLDNLRNGEYPILIPAFKKNNLSLLKIPALKLYTIDPSIYCEYNSEVEITNESKIPIYAGLCNKDSFLKNFYKFDIIKGKTEQEVFDEYCKRRFVINPPHYHEGSGWWRNRFVMANNSKSILLTSDNNLLDKSYKHHILDLKLKSDEELDLIFEEQNKSYNNMIESHEEIDNKIEQILDDLLSNKLFTYKK